MTIEGIPYHIERAISITFSQIGFHCWRQAPQPRAYLINRHRHLFRIRVEVTVSGDGREIEFHDLLDFCLEWFDTNEQGVQQHGEYGTLSCEALAERLGNRVCTEWPNRPVAIMVSEDGECSAIVRFTPS